MSKINWKNGNIFAMDNCEEGETWYGEWIDVNEGKARDFINDVEWEVTNRYLDKCREINAKDAIKIFKTTLKDSHQNPKHYRGGIEPLAFIESHAMNFAEGCIIKYVTRWRKKNGVEDLEKAKVYLQRLIDNEKTTND